MKVAARSLLVIAIFAICIEASSEEGDVYIAIREVRSNFPEGIDLDQLTPIKGLADRNDVVSVCILSDPELQVLLRSVAQRKGADLVDLPGVIVPFREKAELENQRARWTVKPEAVKDGRMIDLEIRLFVDGEETSAFRIVVPDGYNLMCRIDGFGDREWCSFINASLMKPTDVPQGEIENPYLKHLVEEGEILPDIAKFYGIELDEILSPGDGADPSPEAGLYLEIPVRKRSGTCRSKLLA